jgi:hypothetical protein
MPAWLPVGIAALLTGAVLVFMVDRLTGPVATNAPRSLQSPATTVSTLSSAANAPAASPLEHVCQAAVGKANASLAQAVRVEHALAEHTKVMDKLLAGKISPQDALNMGMPSLIHGAHYSARFDQAFADYRTVVEQCHLRD